MINLPFRLCFLRALCGVLLLAAASGALARVKPAPAQPDRPGLNPPKEFPLDSQPPLELPYLAPPEKAAMMIVIAHPDDEGNFPGLIPYVTRVLKLPVVLVVLTSGEGHPAIKGDRSIRENEMRRAAWAYGMPNEPIFGRFRDGAARQTLERNWEIWGGENEAVNFLVPLIRRYRPDVVVTMAFDGEYGHPNHVGAALSTTKACAWAGDAVAVPVREGSAGPWTPRKIYVNKWGMQSAVPWAAHAQEFDWEIPIPDLPGKTCFELGAEGSRHHVSQGLADRPFSRKISRLGLYSSSVGIDGPKADLFQNIDLSGYAPFVQLAEP